MKKLFAFVLSLCLLFIVFPTTSNNIYADEQLKVQIVVNQCTMYESADISSAVMPIKIPHGTQLDVLETYPQSPETPVFYKVTYNTQTGYILITHTKNANIISPQKKLDFHAKLKNDAETYILSNTEYEEVVGTTITKDQEVEIVNGYDTKQTYTLVSFYDENNKILTYYVKTNMLSVYGISSRLIVAISILITCVCIILLLVGFNFKNKIFKPKPKKDNNQ